MLVLATAIPNRATTLPSSYLARSDAALAFSRLMADNQSERLHQHTFGPTDYHAPWPALASSTTPPRCDYSSVSGTNELITVDVDPATLTSMTRTWGPAPRSWGRSSAVPVTPAHGQRRRVQ